MQKLTITNKNVCVIGLGFVGLTLAIKLIDNGFNVYGVETNKKTLGLIKNKKSPFFEPGMDQKLKKAVLNKKLIAASLIKKNISISTYIVTIGTPINSQKKFSSINIENVTKAIASVLKTNDLVILRSTVALGVTNDLVRPILAKTGINFRLAFCPERTIEGNALNELSAIPQIIGGINEESAKAAEIFFSHVTSTLIVADSKAAELTKLISNTYRDVSFAFSNEIAMICQSNNINAVNVIAAANEKYSRCSIPSPGPVAGPCLEKDSYILFESLKKSKSKCNVILTSRIVNERLVKESLNFIIKKIKKTCPNNKIKIGILGLAFKGVPETNDLRGSPSLEIIKSLKKEFQLQQMYGYDPCLNNKEITSLGLKAPRTLNAVFKNAHVILIVNNNKIFQDMNFNKLANLMHLNSFIYDFWNLYKNQSLVTSKNTNYFSVGNHV
jgi:UDP-N-acetyl-D-mannosaminuronic acid dehydrogenase